MTSKVTVGAKVAVVVVIAAIDTVGVDVVVFLPHLNGTLAASVVLVTTVFYLLMWRWQMMWVL